MKNTIPLILMILTGLFYSCTNSSTDGSIKNRDGVEKNQKSGSKEDNKDCCKKPDKSETSEVTCPNCGHKKVETLPTEVCLIAYTCEKCQTVLHPKEGDCCVFCTYGDHKCPSKQSEAAIQP